MKPNEFISLIAPAAQASMRASRVPASIVIAQAALESGWGESGLAKKANNLFGVKASAGWRGETVDMPTTEFVDGHAIKVIARWRKYPNWQACLDDHTAFLHANPRYAPCFAQTTGEGWAKALQTAGYATDPDYAAKVIATMRSHAMARYDAA